MNRKIIAASIAVLAGILLFATNPSEEQFKDYLKHDLEKKAAREGETSKAIMDVLSVPAAAIMGLATERKDLMLFSYYEVNVVNEDRKYIGVFSHFVRIS